MTGLVMTASLIDSFAPGRVCLGRSSNPPLLQSRLCHCLQHNYTLFPRLSSSRERELGQVRKQVGLVVDRRSEDQPGKGRHFRIRLPSSSGGSSSAGALWHATEACPRRPPGHLHSARRGSDRSGASALPPPSPLYVPCSSFTNISASASSTLTFSMWICRRIGHPLLVACPLLDSQQSLRGL